MITLLEMHTGRGVTILWFTSKCINANRTIISGTCNSKLHWCMEAHSKAYIGLHDDEDKLRHFVLLPSIVNIATV